jgi:Uma2 family endonuclease
MQDLLDKIKTSPQLPDLLEEISAFWKQEKQKRQAFYNLVKESDKAEFINGEMIFHSPAKYEHLFTSDNLMSLLKIYLAFHPLGVATHEKAMISLTRNDYEPDICFWLNEKSQHFTNKQMLFPAPDFIVEVLSPSTAKNDRGVKFQDYASHKVTEYWLIDPDGQTIEQYALKGSTYELYQKLHISNTIQSLVITGFKIPVEAIFDSKIHSQTLKNLIKP